MPEETTVNFFDAAVNECPYPAHAHLRDHAPVWKDPATGMYVITRYEDVRSILLDAERFTNEIGSNATKREMALRPDDPDAAPLQAASAARVERIKRLYEDKGWLPAPSLDTLDEPRHMQERRLFDYAFRPSAIASLDPYVEQLANTLIDGFIEDLQCEWIAQFAVPLPLYVIGRQVGVPDEDLPQIKKWTEAYCTRMSLVATEEEALASVEGEIEMQHYFQRRFEELRASPDDSLLSVLVNKEIPEWGRPLNDNELHAEMMVDLFVGGAETTTNSLSEGVVLLVEQPDVWQQLKSDPDRYLDTFVEEVLRLESPVQSLMRKARVDVQLHGVTIPAGAIVNVRYGAANRDEREFDRAAEIDLERRKPRRHLAFGTGAHHCLGAPLARRELYFGFKALVERIDRLWFVEGANDFAHHANFFLRSLKELHIGFSPALRERVPQPAGGRSDDG